MGHEWPRVVRLVAAVLVAAVDARSGLRLRLLRPLEGGQVGAALVALPSGQRAVLSSWPGTLGARALGVAGIVARLREDGYPAPAYLAVPAASAQATGGAERGRVLDRLRRQWRQITRRDFFPPPERETAQAALESPSAVTRPGGAPAAETPAAEVRR